MIRATARFLAAALLPVVTAAILAGCDMQRDSVGYRDITGQDRRQAALDADAARCRYEFESARAGSSRPSNSLISAVLSAPPPALFDACMGAKGWREVP